MSGDGSHGGTGTDASPVPSPKPDGAQSDQVFLQFVSQLEASQQATLYDNIWAVQAILRSVPPLSKYYILRMLYINKALPISMIQSWAKNMPSKHRNALEVLLNLKLVMKEKKKKSSHSSGSNSGTKEKALRLHPTFQRQLRAAYQGVPQQQQEQQSKAVRSISEFSLTPDQVDREADSQWERVLLTLVKSNEHMLSWSKKRKRDSGDRFLDIKQLFISAGLLTTEKGEQMNGLYSRGAMSAEGITDSGFQFLLMNVSSQLWIVIREYVKDLGKKNAANNDQGFDHPLAAALGFIFQLSFSVPYRAYPLNELSEARQRVVKSLSMLGLTLLVGKQREWYIPSKLAKMLSAGLSSTKSHDDLRDGFIVVETNFRLYAYTSSDLQMSILQLFSRVEYQLPNLYVGTITRDSVGAALEGGLTAEVIISYLQVHAHAHVSKRTPIVPETVSDQIRLWALERNRVEFFSAIMYEDIETEEFVEEIARHAQSLRSLLHSDPKERKVVVKLSAHAEMKAFIKENKHRFQKL